MLAKYRPSGNWSLQLVTLAPAALVVCGALGVAYQVALHHIPFIYVDFLLTGLLAATIFAIVKEACRLGKCRNTRIGAALGAVAGTTGLVAAYAADHQLGAPSGVGFIQYIQAKATMGYIVGRGGSGLPIAGVFAYGLWLLEAGVVFLSGVVGGGSGAEAPYCEECDTPARSKVREFTISGVSAETAHAISTADSLAGLMAVPLTGPVPGGIELKYRVVGCPRCKRLGYLAVSLTVPTATTLANGKKQTKTTKLHDDVQLTTEDLEDVAAFDSAARAAATLPAPR